MGGNTGALQIALLRLQLAHIIAESQHISLILMMPCMQAHELQGLQLAKRRCEGSKLVMCLASSNSAAQHIELDALDSVRTAPCSVYNMTVLCFIIFYGGLHMHASICCAATEAIMPPRHFRQSISRMTNSRSLSTCFQTCCSLV
jgi:hypothetical protein